MFFDVFSELCYKKRKTPNGVAKELGFASSSVTQWKHGSVPRRQALEKIADYFGVSVGELLGYAESDQKEKPLTGAGEGLSEAKRILIEKVRSMDDATIDALNQIADQVLSLRGK